ncbi:MAG: serine/threonine protein kinase [Labilithrix sp.]|nr:serine/threonine protein kinase [Labilithrix sp.]
MSTLSPGTQIDRYELVCPIGEGGMAEVWVAKQRGKHGFEKLFAFKCIHARFADHPAFRSMFLDEARIAASIEHPNVAQVFDLGESASMLYLVMEYVDGESLSALLTSVSRRTGASATVPAAVALRIIADVCAGLHAAHRLTGVDGQLRGVVHRDVSPHNVLVGVRGDVKVIDFGIAVAKDRIGSDTEAGALKGKLHYMAPEQATREPLGPSTDVFAAGATLYRLLAGHPPFDGGHDAATLNLLLSGAAPPPLPESVPPLVAAIVERALSHDPGDRYASALEMQTAIEAAIADEGFVPDVGTWASKNLSDRAKERRRELTSTASNIAPIAPASKERVEKVEVPSFVAELGPSPARPTKPAAPPPRAEASPTLASANAAVASESSPVQAPPQAIAPVGVPTEDEPPSAGGPGFMDVRALVARGSVPDHGGPRKPEPHGETDDDEKAQVAAPAREYVGPATQGKPVAGGGGWIKLAGAIMVFALALVVALLFLPRIVQDRIVSSAREAGVELTIARTSVSFGGVTLHGVTAKVVTIPGVELRAEEIHTSGFSARDVRVRGLEAKLDGAATDILTSLAIFYDLNRGRFAGTGAEPRRVTIVAGRLTWNGATGEGSRILASDLGTELESKGVGLEDVRASVGRFEVTTKNTTFGPWAASFDRNPTTSRVRLLFDPPVPDGPSALFVWGKSSATKLTVRIPRSPLARLGIRADELGVPADPSTDVELKLEGEVTPAARVEGKGQLDVFGARIKGIKTPLDVKIEGTAAGPVGKPLELEKTSVTVGPFVAAVAGTITGTDRGFRLDASWRTTPIPCERLARAEVKSLGPIAAALQELARATGAVRVIGTAHASGLVKYDTSAPDEGSFTYVTRETCGLSIFGQ